MGSIQLHKICKSFRQGKRTVNALSEINLELQSPEICGLIGPDGSGKTTLFRILTTLLKPDSGNAMMDNMDLVKKYKSLRPRIGYMPGKFSLYEDLSVRENLQFYARLFGTTIEKKYDQIKDIYQQIELFSDRRAGKLSGGMKQKLALCCCLIHSPEFLFLDEPTTGVDPVSRYEFWEMLKKLKAKGMLIMVSTPYMDEAKLCDRIAFIQRGKILSVIRPQKLLSSYDRPTWSFHGEPRYELVNALRNYPNTRNCLAFGEGHHITFSEQQKNEPENLKQYLKDRGYTQYRLESVTPGLEDYFLELLSKDAG